MKKQVFAVVMAVLLLITIVEPMAAQAAEVNNSSEQALDFAQTTNVALHAIASASGQCNENEAAQFAIDGQTDTKWCDNSAQKNKWLSLDLGQEYNINQWVVQNACINESGNCPFGNTKDFRLQKSDDGETWVDVDVVKKNSQTIVSRYVPSFTAQYVRLFIDRGNYDNNIARIYEFEVYGTPADQVPLYPDTNLEAIDYVDPFMNTLGDNGQTNPGVKLPFGLVYLGPDSDGGAFSGYYYESKYLKGFSHSRFSGVGCSGAGGDVMMMPVSGDFTNNSNNYKQKYDKASEDASPGYYTVKLASDVLVELTASERVGFHQYTFGDGTNDGSVLIDLSNAYSGRTDATLNVVSDHEITGMVKAPNVCGHGYYTLYYSIAFDQDFDNYISWSGNDVGQVAARTGAKSGVRVNFDTTSNKVIKAKVGISSISAEQATYEREHEIADWDFAAQHEQARQVWSELLNKVEVTSDDEENKTIFYTQLYHAYLHPSNVTSSAGTFRAARDEETIRDASELGDDFEYYSGWATWDDFRKYSLYSILSPAKYNNMVKSLVDLYETRGSYVQYGLGYWPTATVRHEFNGAVILDAYTKGFTDFDAQAALQGMAIDTDNYSASSSQISGQLEKAYSAYYPMKLAALLGDNDTYEKYREIALSYKKLWNAKQKDDEGNVRGFFTPNAATVPKVSNVNEFAYQGNLWHYRWFVPHDIAGLAELRGSNYALADDLIYFFDDISEYMAVNEEDVDAPYIFNYLGYPYLTQYYAREYTTEVVTQKYHNHGLYNYPIKSRIYRADPEGYLPSMDDDAGAMSSWFVYSAMGIYPGNVGDPYYLIGSPIFDKVVLHLDNGNTFTIEANNVSSDNRYIQSATWNGNTFDQAWISYEAIMAGGELTFEMGDTPNFKWGADPENAPPTMDYDQDIEGLYAREELVGMASHWQYYDEGALTGEAWKTNSFDDASWKTGQAVLGYGTGNSGITTVVGYGSNASNKYPTTYFRKSFELTNANEVEKLEASLIRDDGAVVYLNGQEVIRTNMPAGTITYNTYANVTVNNERDVNTYSIDPVHLVEGTNVIAVEVHQVNGTSSDIAFDFGLEMITKLLVPDAPNNPIVDDEDNTFGWTNVPGYDAVSQYEYSTNGGVNWKQATSNPQLIAPDEYAAGKVRVRVKANPELGQASGKQLLSQAPFTYSDLWDIYDLAVAVDRTGNMTSTVSGQAKSDYDGPMQVVFQLTKSDEVIMTNAVPVEAGDFEATQMFNAISKEYTVNVYLVDDFKGNIYESLWLARPVTPNPQSEEDITNEFPEEEEGGDPEELEPLMPRPQEDDDHEEESPIKQGKIEFEKRDDWSTGRNQFNNNPLKTEGNNGGTVVANTFTGAWLAYYDVDFGEDGKNIVTIEYDAPSNRVPTDAVLEFHLGDVNGELIGVLPIEITGNGWGAYKQLSGQLLRTVTGLQHVFIVMKGSTTSDLPYMGNFDHFSFTSETTRNGLDTIELEQYDAWSEELNPDNDEPLKTEKNGDRTQVANTFDGAWLAFERVEFGATGVNEVEITYAGKQENTAADAKVEIHLGSKDGKLIGVLETPPTGLDWSTYKTATVPLTETVQGIHDVYVVFTGTTDNTFKYIGNFDRLKFDWNADIDEPEDGEDDGDGGEPIVIEKLEFEAFTAINTSDHPIKNSPLKTEANNGGTVVANTFDGAWLEYKNLDFGSEGKNLISIVYDAPDNKSPNDIQLELRTGSLDGEVVGFIDLPNTGTNWGNYKELTATLSETLKGKQDLYVIMHGSILSPLEYVGNYDSMTFSYLPLREDYAQLELETYNQWSTDLNPAKNSPLKVENGGTGKQVANTFHDAWLAYEHINFGSSAVDEFTIYYVGNTGNTASDASVEIRLDNVDGELLGTVSTPPTGSGWGTYRAVKTSLNQSLTGIHSIYLVLKGTTDSKYTYIGNFDYAQFSKAED